MTVVVIVVIISMAISMTVAMPVSMVFVIMAFAVVIVVFVLAVVVAVVMADFLAIFAAVEVSLPTAMTSPVSMLAANGERAVITEARIVCAVNVTAEAYRSVKPGAGSEEDSAGKPRRSVIAERGASIGCVVVIAVGANGLDSDIDGDLYLSFRNGGREAEERENGKREKPRRFHLFLLGIGSGKSLAVARRVGTPN